MQIDIHTILQGIAIMAIPVVLAITLHEVAHGWVAYKLGDPTAKHQGRLTLNPLAHVDPFGTILLPLISYIFAGFIIGSAKPVPVNFHKLRNPKRDMIWVAAAGPGVNIAMALICGILFQLLLPLTLQVSSGSGLLSIILVPLILMLKEGIKWNVVLAIFNLIPVPPLDGSRILAGVLPYRQAEFLGRIEPYGLLIVTFLVFLNPFGFMTHIIWPIMGILTRLFAGIPVF
ncbi:MAG: site-2 protease family protein [Nitrospirae bacterium]|nr:site-2 protease family protein [Nitrospirota bacterium]